MSHYGSVERANAFFAHRLHSDVWTDADADTREKALCEATHQIDKLAFKGDKSTVAAVRIPATTVNDSGVIGTLNDDDSNNDPGDNVRSADLAQALEFPRDNDTVVPAAIEHACYFIAYALLDGRDPQLELENLAVTSHRYSSVGTAYNRDIAPLEHIVNGIASVNAWNLLKPFLRPNTEVRLTRVS
jgi:hypothetical protein